MLEETDKQISLGGVIVIAIAILKAIKVIVEESK